MLKNKLSYLPAVVFASLLIIAMMPLQPVAQEQSASELKTKRVPTLRGKVYEQLARAQKAGDEGNIEEAVAILDQVQGKADSMNSYEKAMMFNFYGFIYYNAEDYDKAFESFKQVVEQDPIPESFAMSTLFSLSQLSLMKGDYDSTIKYLEDWETLNTGAIPAKNYVIKAQAMYQKKDYVKAAEYIDAAVELQEADPEDGIADENWYILQRAVYYELKQPKKVTEILVKLVRFYEKPKYWLQLGGMYGEIGEEKKQLAVMESAYQKGYVTSGQDIFNLAQLYYYHQVPYKAARLMEQGMADGVLERNLRNLRFLSQSWAFAKESDKAIPVMQAASELSEDGELNAQLAQIFLNTEKWDDAIAQAELALQRGNIRSPGTAHLVIGMALYNKQQFAAALNALAEAEKFKQTEKMAQQWQKFVSGEKASFEQLQAELSD